MPIVRTLPWLIALSGIATVCGWRWLPSLGIVASLSTLVLAWGYAVRNPAGARRLQPWFGLGAVATLALRMVAAPLWPCEWHCQNPRFATLFGIPIEGVGLVVGGAWSAAGFSRSRWHAWLTWGMAGACGFYLAVLVALHLPCRHCLAVHTLLLGGVLLGWTDAMPWRHRLLALIAGGGLVAGLHALGAPPPPPAPPPIDPSGLAPPPMAPTERP